MDKKKKKDMILIQGVNVAPMTEKELKDLHEQLDDQLKELKEDEFMEMLETEMIRKALVSAEEKLQMIEEENSLLRNDLSNQKEQEAQLKATTFDERKKIPPDCFRLIYNNKMLDSDGNPRVDKLPVDEGADEVLTELTELTEENEYFKDEKSEEKQSEDEKDEDFEEEFIPEEGEEEEEEEEVDEEELGDIEESSEKIIPRFHAKPVVKALPTRRERLKEIGIDLKSLKIITDPDDPQFYKSVKEENIGEVTELKQEIKLYEYELSTACDEIEKVFKSRLTFFNKLWTEEIKNKLIRKIEKADKKKDLTYEMIEEHLQWTQEKRENDKNKLRMKLNNLDQARTKMVGDRYKRKEEYMKDKFYMEKMMVTENYDTVIQQLKENHNIVYVNSQQFFRDTAENDILLIISLKNELKNLQSNMDKMDEEIARMKAGIKKIKGPLEESEKETRWMETFVAAISKDTKSMACHKKYNEELQKTIDSIHDECIGLENDIKEKEKSFAAANLLKENVTEWSAKYKDSNAFVGLMKQAFKSDSRKIQKMENTLISKGLILPKHVPLIRELVQKKVEAAKKIQFARQKEVKAFNELIHQLEIRSANLLIDSWPKVHKMGGVPYRKTPANLLATYDTTKKYQKAHSNELTDFLVVQKII